MPLESLFLPEFLDLSGFLDLGGFLNPLEFLSFCLALKPELEKKNNLPELHPPSFHGITQQPLLTCHFPETLNQITSLWASRLHSLAQSSSGCAPPGLGQALAMPELTSFLLFMVVQVEP